MKRADPTLADVWRWPTGLAALTLFGLLAALLGQEGVWLWLSWCALGTPLAAALFCLALPR